MSAEHEAEQGVSESGEGSGVPLRDYQLKNAVLTAIWDSGLTTGQKLLALYLVRRVHWGTWAIPTKISQDSLCVSEAGISIPELCYRASMGRTQVRKIIWQWDAEGLITIYRRANSPHGFRLHPGAWLALGRAQAARYQAEQELRRQSAVQAALDRIEDYERDRWGREPAGIRGRSQEQLQEATEGVATSKTESTPAEATTRPPEAAEGTHAPPAAWASKAHKELQRKLGDKAPTVQTFEGLVRGAAQIVMESDCDMASASIARQVRRLWIRERSMCSPEELLAELRLLAEAEREDPHPVWDSLRGWNRGARHRRPRRLPWSGSLVPILYITQYRARLLQARRFAEQDVTTATTATLPTEPGIPWRPRGQQGVVDWPADELRPRWLRVQRHLAAKVGDIEAALWLEPLSPEAITADGALLLSAPSETHLAYVAETFLRALQAQVSGPLAFVIRGPP